MAPRLFLSHMASRTSARLKARIENGPTIHPSCNTTQIITKPSTSRPHKKQKSKAVANSTKEIQPANYARVKGQKGKLKNMLEMPIDILFEVFAKLEPVDLLHLSRATKDLRNILISPNATFLWKTAYQNLRFPPPICPPGINLRYYTNFLYGQNCHSCGSVYGTVLHYTAHVRLCRICVPKYLKKWNETVQKGAVNVKGPSYYSYSTGHRYSATISYRLTYEAIKDDPVALGAFYSERDSPVFNRHEHGGKIKRWWVQERACRAAKLEELRVKRTTAIVQKIHAEGYSDELEGLLIRSLPGVNSTKELSDQDWERIKPRLMGILRLRRQGHLEEVFVNEFKWRMQQLSNVVNEFHSKMPKPFVIPPTVHFVRTAPFVDLIKNTPINQKIVDSEIQDLAPHIPDITTSWRESADNCLLDLIPQISTSRTRKGKGKEISTSRLELATTFFKCHWCREPISYPRILMHRCLRHRKLDDSEDEESEDDLVDGDADTKDEEEEEEHADVGEGEHLPEQKKFCQHINVDADSVWNKMTSWYGTDWNEGNNQITFDDEASGFAQVIVKACGEDPDTVTFDHMTKIDARVECLRCSKAKEGRNRKRLVMNWTTAILHDISKHFEETPDENGWLLISEEDTIEAKDLESKLSTKWRTFHLETSHATTPETGASAYFYLPLDTPMRRPPYAVRI